MPFIYEWTSLDEFTVLWRDVLFSIHHPSLCCSDHGFRPVPLQRSGPHFLLVYLGTSLYLRGYADCCQSRALRKTFLSPMDRAVCRGWKQRCSFKSSGVAIHYSPNRCWGTRLCDEKGPQEVASIWQTHSRKEACPLIAALGYRALKWGVERGTIRLWEKN